MPIVKGLEGIFDSVASEYAHLRPGYPEELYQAIFDYVPINENSNVVEIGSGGGQATAPILTTGCELTAVEVGERFSELLKTKFKDYRNFKVITAKFENATLPENTFDLVFSASAFHWIPKKEGYGKVYSILKEGGAFAQFANHPFPAKGNPELSSEIDQIYGQYYYKFNNRNPKRLSEYTHHQAKDCTAVAAKYGFSDIRYKLFHRERTLGAKEYVKLLGTYSDHIVIPESIRAEFFSRIEEAINNHGATITIYDTIDLELAKK